MHVLRLLSRMPVDIENSQMKQGVKIDLPSTCRRSARGGQSEQNVYAEMDQG